MSKKKEKELKVEKVPSSIEEMKSTLNPYVPLFIAKTPWYLTDDHPTLHPKEEKLKGQKGLDEWYQRGQKQGKKVTKYRTGACTNCGAMSHKIKDCVERPRKVGAKYTGEDIQQDEMVQEFKHGYDAKRDRWNGYDPQSHMELVEQWKLVEDKRKKVRDQKQTEKEQLRAIRKLENPNETSSDESDEDKYAEGEALVGHVVDPKERVTVRNLRIREDTAKYLLNLDLSSAHYDPKTRSMLENPNAPKMSSYKGDDFERYTGDVKESSRLNEFSWDSESKGPQLTVHSNPTQGELLYKKIKEQKGGETKVSLSILDKYRGGEYLKSIPKEMLLAQTEHYVEYTPSGELLKPGAKGKAVVKSKYLEDVMNGNHLEVWGSWWKDQVWGYACCHSTIKAAYCGGRHAIDQEIHQSTKKFKEPMKQVPTKSLLEIHNEDKNGKKKVMQKPGILRAGDGPIDIDQEKLKDAIEKEKKRKRVDDGSSKVGVEMTEEQLEAYRMNKVSREDPMANYKDEEDY